MYAFQLKCNFIKSDHTLFIPIFSSDSYQCTGHDKTTSAGPAKVPKLVSSVSFNPPAKVVSTAKATPLTLAGTGTVPMPVPVTVTCS